MKKGRGSFHNSSFLKKDQAFPFSTLVQNKKAQSQKHLNESHQAKTVRTLFQHKGFTLIEILIVLGILAAVTLSLNFNNAGSSQKEYRRFFRRLSNFSKKAKSAANIENKTYRLVFNFNEEKAPKIRVEKSSKEFLFADEKSRARELKTLYEKDKRQDSLSEEEKKKLQQKEKNKSPFTEAPKFKADVLRIPSNLRIVQIETAGLPEAIEGEGLSFLHHIARSITEEVAIQFETQSKSLKWTLLSDSLTGELYVYGGHIELKDLKER